MSIPFFHTTGCQAVLVSALVAGAKLVLMRRFDAGEAPPDFGPPDRA